MAFESSKSNTNFPFTSFLIITTEKLVGSSNYVLWATSIELSCMRQGIEDYLTTKTANIKSDTTTWIRIDANLCSLLCNTIDTQPQPISRLIEHVVKYRLKSSFSIAMTSNNYTRWCLI